MARLLGVTRQTISNWLSRGEAPANKAVAIEVASGVSRRDLRSDWRDYWPDLDQTVPREAVDLRGTQSDRRQVQVPIGFPDQRGTKPDRRGGAQGAEQGV